MERQQPDLKALRHAYKERLEITLRDLRKLLGELCAAAAPGARAETEQDTLRGQVHQLAHRIAGTAGTYGFGATSVMAAHIEEATEPSQTFAVLTQVWKERTLALPGWDLNDDAKCLPASAVAEGSEGTPGAKSLSHDETSDRIDTTSSSESTREHEPPRSGRHAGGCARLLVLDDDSAFLARAKELGAAKLVAVEVASTLPQALEAAAVSKPDGMILECGLAGCGDGELLAEDLGRHPSLTDVPLAFTSADGSCRMRASAARAGGVMFFEKPLREHAFFDFIHQVTCDSSDDVSRVLVVDDDPDLFAQLEAWFAPYGWEAVHCLHPAQILSTLDRVRPDLVILDQTMPEVSGIDCCRVVRTSAHWGALPILLLTARREGELRLAAYAAGADDYVNKPVLREELIARVSSRLERQQLIKQQAQTDGLTQLFNRAAFAERLERRLAECHRTLNPVALCVIDLDHFKHVNDTYGHLAGDTVLQALGQLLRGRFRTEDLRCRWGGEEFAVALVGETAPLAAQVIRRVLDALSQMEFTAADGRQFRVTFSAGVAQCPRDGDTLKELFAAADARLYLAKENGRAQVLAAAPQGVVPRKRVLVVDDDPATVASLRRMFEGCLDVYEAGDGAEGLAVAASVRPDVVISDSRMPTMDGVAMLAHIRDMLPRTGRILLTGKRTETDLCRAINQAGIHYYLDKPVLSAELKQAVSALSRSLDLERELEHERRLKRSDTGFRRRIIEALPEPTLMLARDGTVAELNDASAEFFGQPRGRLIHQDAAQLLPADLCEGVQQRRQRDDGVAECVGDDVHVGGHIARQVVWVPAPPEDRLAGLLVFHGITPRAAAPCGST